MNETEQLIMEIELALKGFLYRKMSSIFKKLSFSTPIFDFIYNFPTPKNNPLSSNQISNMRTSFETIMRDKRVTNSNPVQSVTNV